MTINPENPSNSNTNPILSLSGLEILSRRYLFQKQKLLAPLSRNIAADREIGPQLSRLGGLDEALSTRYDQTESRNYTTEFLTLQNAAYLQRLGGNDISQTPNLVTLPLELEELRKTVTTVAVDTAQCCKDTLSRLDQIESAINKAKIEILTEIRKQSFNIIEVGSERVADKVVGESFARYNNTTSFYPTLIVVCLEKKQGPNKRRCQFKIKFNKLPDEITERDISDLKKHFSELKTHYINVGNMRATYVSSDKKFKNVLFVKEEKDAKDFFKFILPLVGREYDEKCFSFTTGRDRTSITRRKDPLSKLEPQTVNYREPFHAELYRVVLLVNGLERPLVIYRSYELP